MKPFIIFMVLTTLILQVIDREPGEIKQAGGWRSIIKDAQDIDLKLNEYWTVNGDTLIGDSGSEMGDLVTFGQQDWQDYELDFHVTMYRGGNASSFIRRTADGKKFYACNLLAGRKAFRIMLLDNTLQAPMDYLSTEDYNFKEGLEYHVCIAAHGNSISTYVDGRLVNRVIDNVMQSGHAAFALWYNRVRIRNPRYRLFNRDYKISP